MHLPTPDSRFTARRLPRSLQGFRVQGSGFSLFTRNSQLATSNSRSGLSLLEILISVFVLLVGLLGVAAMIPVGRFQIMQAANADRSAACARAALSELRIRGWLDPEIWLAPDLPDAPPTRYQNGFLGGPLFPSPPRYLSQYLIGYAPNWIQDDQRLFPAGQQVIFLPVSAPYQNIDPNYAGDPNFPLDKRRAIRWRDSFAIDPIYCAANESFLKNPHPLEFRRFPLTLGGVKAVPPTSNYYYPTWWSMPRVTIDMAPTPLSKIPPYFVNASGTLTLDYAQKSFGAAAMFFTSRDDQLVQVPNVAEERPRQVMLWQNGYGSAYPDRPTDRSGLVTTDYPLRRQFEGNYSWMAIVTPMPAGPDFFQPLSGVANPPTVGYCYTDNIRRYEVSIVVFRKRNADLEQYPQWLSDLPNSWGDLARFPPPERLVDVRLDGGGWGGGDATLVGCAPTNLDPEARQALETAWLNVKPNDWIMLMAPNGIIYQYGTRMVYKWYRVISVADDAPLPTENDLGLGDVNNNGETDDLVRRVTLAGPDWRADANGDGFIGWYDANGNGVIDTGEEDIPQAVLVDDVLGVYTTTVETDHLTEKLKPLNAR